MFGDPDPNVKKARAHFGTSRHLGDGSLLLSGIGEGAPRRPLPWKTLGFVVGWPRTALVFGGTLRPLAQ